MNEKLDEIFEYVGSLKVADVLPEPSFSVLWDMLSNLPCPKRFNPGEDASTGVYWWCKPGKAPLLVGYNRPANQFFQMWGRKNPIDWDADSEGYLYGPFREPEAGGGTG
jgi:hypothetical protein